MTLPLARQGFVVKSLDQTKARRARKHCDVLPLLIPLEDVARERRSLLVHAAMLLNTPHAILCLYHI
jgi:hypothetical protein